MYIYIYAYLFYLCTDIEICTHADTCNVHAKLCCLLIGLPSGTFQLPGCGMGPGWSKRIDGRDISGVCDVACLSSAAIETAQLGNLGKPGLAWK